MIFFIIELNKRWVSEFEEYEHDLKLRLSRTCSTILFNIKIKSILKEWT